MEDTFDVATISGESDHELVEKENAKYLVKDMKSKRRRKQRELSKELVSPKDDLAQELNSAKKRGKKRLADTVKDEDMARSDTVPRQVDDGGSVSGSVPYDDDGTVPMPAEETAETEEVMETDSRLSRSRKKKQKDIQEDEIIAETAKPTSSNELPEFVIDPPPTTQKEDRRMSRIDRLKSRMQKAMTAGVDEAKKEESEIQREARQKSLKEKSLTQFDDEDVLETERITGEKASKLKQRWKRLGESTVNKVSGDQPTVDEAYDFFTHVWEPEPDTAPAPTMKPTTTEPPTVQTAVPGPSMEEDVVPESIAEPLKQKSDKEEPSVNEDDAEPTPGMSDETLPEEDRVHYDEPEEEIPLLDEFIAGYGITSMQKPVYTPSKEMIEKEREVLYRPSSITIPASEKIFEEKEPRYMEDEGFYVGIRPRMATHNVNRLEHRLLQQPDKGRKWFGEDGRIKFLPDPLAQCPSRPPITEDIEPALQIVNKKAVMKDFDSRYIVGAIENTGTYQIDIDINSILYTHHHLFSREHVLATQLSRLYDQYLLRKRRNMVDFLTEKREMSTADRENYQRRLEDYQYEVRKTRTLRDMEESTNRSLLKSILTTWRDIKALRTQQTYTNTSHKLQIRKENTDKVSEEAAWMQELEDEVSDIMGEETRDYDERLIHYMRELELFQSQVERKKAAKKRQRKRARLSAKQEAEATSDTEAVAERDPEQAINDQSILDEEDLVSPEEPQKPDPDAIREKVNAKMRENRRLPEAGGGPTINDNNYPLHSILVCRIDGKMDEQARRDAVSKYRMFVRVLFNGKEVSRTDTKTMTQDFKVNFGQIYNLKIVHWPESIKFEMYEVSSFSRTLVSELYAAVPEPTVMSGTIQLDPLDFSCDQQVSHQHSAVGSGVSWSMMSGTSEIHSLVTSGVLWCSVGWAVAEDGTPLVPPITHKTHSFYSGLSRVDPVAAIGISGMVDIDKLSEWVTQSRLDPNDPANADIAYLFRPKDTGMSMNKMADHFRLEQLQEEFNFTSDEDMDNLKRFQMIQLRDQEVPEFKNYKLIPSLEREIPRDAFSDYEKRLRDEEKIKRADDSVHRAAVAQFMQKVREQVIRRWRLASHQKRLEEVIVEEAVPNIAMLTINFMKLLQPRRPLRPERKERKKVTATAIKGEDIHLLVSITRAFDIPVRRQVTYTGSMQTARGTTEVENRNMRTSDSLVNPFVEVTFQRNTTSTTVGEGPNPSFNEELILPFKAPNDDYSPGNLQAIKDRIYINLFDQVTVDILEDDRLKDTNIHQRLEKKWLGNIEIPFTTVYNNGKIDGTFLVNSPPVLLGYTYDMKQANAGDVEIDVGHGERSSTYVSMFLTIEPPLVLADQMKDRFTTNESEQLLEYADKWMSELHERFPKRHYLTSVIDVSGKTVFVTRYFRPLQPPPEVSQSDEMMARFVSLIPFSSDNSLFPGVCDIWARCDEFLSMLSGDEEEHAILLANYFLAQSKHAWIIIGSAIPEGPTAYVLTTDATHQLVIWNPNSGQKYSSIDSFCPLQSIWCLINGDNIWANIQQNEQPSRISFDVNNTSYWKPFFTSKTLNPGLSSVQPEELMYVPTDPGYVRDLQEKIEQTLKNKMMEWRSMYITRWNRYCTQSFRNLLPKLEETRGEGASDQHLAELEHFLGSYKISGFPMNMPFNDIPSIIETVFSTGVHAFDSSDVEFALAVHIHPYPSSVLSVWIYIASLIRIR